MWWKREFQLFVKCSTEIKWSPFTNIVIFLLSCAYQSSGLVEFPCCLRTGEHCSCFRHDQCDRKFCSIRNKPRKKCSDTRPFRYAVKNCVNGCRRLQNRCSCSCKISESDRCSPSDYRVCVSGVLRNGAIMLTYWRVAANALYNMLCFSVCPSDLWTTLG